MAETISNKEITLRLTILGKLMELHNMDEAEAKKYQAAAYNLDKSGADVIAASDDELKKIPGVNKLVLSKINELKTTGELEALDAVLEQTPAGLFELINLKGLGPKKIGALWRELGIESAAALEKACAENKVAGLRGFGAKTQENIVRQLEFVKSGSNQNRYASVEEEITRWHDWLKTVLSDAEFYLTGEAYRLDQVLSLVEFVVSENSLQKLKGIAPLKYVQSALDDTTLEFYNGVLRVHVHGFPEEYLLWHRFDLSLTQGHRDYLVGNGWKEKPVAIMAEEDVYDSLGLPYTVPEMREGLHEHEWAAKYSTNNLVEYQNASPEHNCFNGMIHMHTKYSDGYNTTREMAEECMKMGAEYMVLSDHSQSAYYAGGLKVDKLVKQHTEVDVLNDEYAGRFKIFKSIESDILGSGSLDYPDDVLATFDLVIASIHAGQKMDEGTATRRLINAIENPFTTILGHPTGRQLLIRPGYPINHKKVIDACARNNVVIEINANPRRLDIDWTWVWHCMEKGVILAINPDAHSTDGLYDIRFGVNVARKGGLVRQRLLNALSLAEFELFLQEQRKKR